MPVRTTLSLFATTGPSFSESAFAFSQSGSARNAFQDASAAARLRWARM